MATFKSKEGEWKTSETGVHYFIPDGMTPEEAWKQWSENKREYQTYWIEDKPNKYGIVSSTGVTKKEYEQALAKGEKGHIKPYGQGFFERIPEDIEYKMDQALANITSTTDKKDFFTQLRNNLGGGNLDTFRVLKDSFSEEIAEKYNKLIEPKVKKVESISKNNASEIFDNSLKIHGLPNSEFTNKMKQNFKNGTDEKSQILVAGLVSEFGLEFTNHNGDKEGTYFSPLFNTINILNDDNDIPTLYHECGHKLFNLHNIKNTDLLATIKSELGSKGIKNIQTHFRDIAAKHYEYSSYKEISDKLEAAKKLENDKYDKLDKQWREKNGIVTYLNSADHHNFVYRNQEALELAKVRQQLEVDEYRINNLGRSECWKYSSLCDMISAATLNTHNDNYGYGHTQTYWRSDKNLQADEFWAEMIEMKSSGNTEEYELIRKFAPKSVKRFEELFEEVYKKRGEILKL